MAMGADHKFVLQFVAKYVFPKSELPWAVIQMGRLYNIHLVGGLELLFRTFRSLRVGYETMQSSLAIRRKSSTVEGVGSDLPVVPRAA